jgi:amino acid permease
MLNYIVFVTGALNMIGSIVYVKDMFAGRAKPNKVTWLMWSLGGLIAGSIALSQGVTFAAVPIFVSGLSPLIVFAFSLFIKEAYWELKPIDWVCGAFSLCALIAWLGISQPIIAIFLAIISDGLASLPTMFKSWKYPETESMFTYVGGLFSNGSAFLVTATFTIESIAFSSYSTFVCAFILFAIYRKKIQALFQHPATN